MYTLPNLFRPYIEGREAAIKENWQDLLNFNSTLKGQMENALYGETMGDAADMSHDQAAKSHINTTLAAANFPVGLQAAALGQYGQSTYGKGLVDAKLTNQLTGQQLAAQNNVQGMDLSRLQYNLSSNELKSLNEAFNKLTPEERNLFNKVGLGIQQYLQPQTAGQNGVVVTPQNQNQNPDITSFEAKQAEKQQLEQPNQGQ